MTIERENKIRNVLCKRQMDLTVVMENVNDPHNISAVLRTCDAIGIHEIKIIDKKELPEYKKLGKKSSASAVKWVKKRYYTEINSCVDNLKKEGFKIYSTHLADKSIPLFDIDFTEKIAIVFGNETEGVSAEMAALSDVNFKIPQVGMIPSLNISVACAVTLYEAFRQRYLKGFYEKKNFNDKYLEELFNEFKML